MDPFINLVIRFLFLFVYLISTGIIGLLFLPKCPLKKWEDICSKFGGTFVKNNRRTIVPINGRTFVNLTERYLQ